MNAFVKAGLGVGGEVLVAEVALVGLGDDVGHLLVLSQLPRRQALATALVASAILTHSHSDSGLVWADTGLDL